jgi:hypothetical protein
MMSVLSAAFLQCHSEEYLSFIFLSDKCHHSEKCQWHSAEFHQAIAVLFVILLQHFKYFFEVSFYIVQLSVILLSVILPNVVSPFTFFVFEEGANPLFSGPVGRNKNSFCQKKVTQTK